MWRWLVGAAGVIAAWFALVVMLGTGRAPELGPASESDTQGIALNIARAIREQDAELGQRQFDIDTLVQLSLVGVHMTSDRIAMFRANSKFGELFERVFLQAVGEGAEITELRRETTAEGVWIRYRVATAEGGYNHVAVLVSQVGDRGKIVDLWMLNLGLRWSELGTAAVRLESRGSDALRRLSIASQDRRHGGVLAAYNDLPPEEKQVRMVQLLRLVSANAELGVDDPGYATILQEIVEMFPDDGFAAYRAVELAAVQEDHEAQVRHAQRLFELEGPDPFILMDVAYGQWLNGEPKAALATLADAETLEPEQVAVVDLRLEIALDMEDHKQAAAALTRLWDLGYEMPADALGAYGQSKSYQRLRAELEAR